MKAQFHPVYSCGGCQFIRGDFEGNYCVLMDPAGENLQSSHIKNPEKVKGRCPILYCACVQAIPYFEVNTE